MLHGLNEGCCTACMIIEFPMRSIQLYVVNEPQHNSGCCFWKNSVILWKIAFNSWSAYFYLQENAHTLAYQVVLSPYNICQNQISFDHIFLIITSNIWQESHSLTIKPIGVFYEFDVGCYGSIPVYHVILNCVIMKPLTLSWKYSINQIMAQNMLMWAITEVCLSLPQEASVLHERQDKSIINVADMSFINLTWLD